MIHTSGLRQLRVRCGQGQVWYLIVSIPDLCNLITSIIEIYAQKLYLAFLLRSLMPTSAISKLFYKFLWLQMALDNSTMKSYNSNLH